MDHWKKCNEKSLPGKEDFYNYLNTEDITDADYAPAKRVCKYFELKKNNIMICMFKVPKEILIVFENCQNTCLDICDLDPAKILLAPGLG